MDEPEQVRRVVRNPFVTVLLALAILLGLFAFIGAFTLHPGLHVLGCRSQNQASDRSRSGPWAQGSDCRLARGLADGAAMSLIPCSRRRCEPASPPEPPLQGTRAEP